jgi:pantetheine-phosphate adenylyltransferase
MYLLYCVKLEDSLDASSHFKTLQKVIADAPNQTTLDVLVCAQLLQSGRRRTFFYPVQKLISAFYLEVARYAKSLDKEVDATVIIQGFCGYDIQQGWQYSRIAYADEQVLDSCLPEWRRLQGKAEFKSYERTSESSTATVETDDRQPQSFPCVAVGGTFDHLHDGHKILLSMTAWFATEKVICGITDDALLQKKKHKELLEPLNARRENVKRFFHKFKRGIQYDLPAINDVFGPTGYVDAIDALVASKETEAGGKMIEEERARKSLRKLEMFYIEVIGADGKIEGEAMQELKLSSTAIREKLARARKL